MILKYLPRLAVKLRYVVRVSFLILSVLTTEPDTTKMTLEGMLT